MIALLFALALLVGFLTGIAFKDALDLFSATDRLSGRRRMNLRTAASWVSENILTLAVVAVMLMNGLLGVLLISQRDDLSEYSRCSATWQRDFGASYRARTDAAAEVSKAVDRVIRSVTTEDPRVFQKAVENYIEVRERQDREREKNPLPEPPEQLCGTPTP